MTLVTWYDGFLTWDQKDEKRVASGEWSISVSHLYLRTLPLDDSLPIICSTSSDIPP